MPKTTKTKPSKPRPRVYSQRLEAKAGADALTARRDLQRRLRVERDIVKLSGQLENAIRRSDARLADFAAALLQRASRTNVREAARDVERDAAIQERMPAPVE